MESVVQKVFENNYEETIKNEINQPVEETKKVENKELDFDVQDARILVVGVGGAGNNCVTRLSELKVNGADTIAVNTDAKHLSLCKAAQKVLIGKELTRGLGAGGYPSIGRQAAEENERALKNLLKEVDMVFLTLGLGGGTGSGAAPVIAKLARDLGSIVIACVTMPFKLEGSRIVRAEDGLSLLRTVCDTVIVIENDRLLKIAGNKPLQEAFGIADDLIATMIKGITETISTPSLVNLDYADVKTIMHSGGVAAVGFGESDSRNKAEDAVMKALNNPLLEVSYEGGSGALIHITGGEDLKLEEITKIGDYVSKNLDPDAQVIWGSRIDPEYKKKVRVITIITGVKSPYILGPQEEERGISNELGIQVVKN